MQAEQVGKISGLPWIAWVLCLVVLSSISMLSSMSYRQGYWSYTPEFELANTVGIFRFATVSVQICCLPACLWFISDAQRQLRSLPDQSDGIDARKLCRRWIRRARAASVICLIQIGMFVLFVWPTLYRYEFLDFTKGEKELEGRPISLGDDVYPPYHLGRINRLTGKQEILGQAGWMKKTWKESEEDTKHHPNQ